MPRPKLTHWLLFVLLSLIWGSSFILMKEGLVSLNPYQVASIRILIAGLCMFPFLIKFARYTLRRDLWTLFLSGILGNGIPAYLFCLAESHIDSNLAGIINALTPVFTVLVAVLIYGQRINLKQIAGIAVGFAGICFLMESDHGSVNEWKFGMLAVGATLCYGLNLNLVRHKLHHLPSLHIASAAFSMLGILELPVMYLAFSSYHPSDPQHALISVMAALTLGVLNTALTVFLFYQLLKSAGSVFASMVTYGIPIVAVFWGLLAGEPVGWSQPLSLLAIFAGVYLVARTRQQSLTD